MNWLLWGILALVMAAVPLVDDDLAPRDWLGFQLVGQPVVAAGIAAGALIA